MANCAIFEKGKDKITHLIIDCVQLGRNFKGSNMKVSGVKEHIFDTKWTEDIAHVILNDQGEIIGYDKKISELTDALWYEGEVVSCRADVDAVTVKLIRARYPLNEELKILRLGQDSEAWQQYNDYVAAAVSRGREFKDKHFK